VLSVTDYCLRSRNHIDVIVPIVKAGEQSVLSVVDESVSIKSERGGIEYGAGGEYFSQVYKRTVVAFSDLRKRQARKKAMRKHFNGNRWHMYCGKCHGRKMRYQWKEIFDSQMKTSFLKSLGIVSLAG
jgi:hypothetical protein